MSREEWIKLRDYYMSQRNSYSIGGPVDRQIVAILLLVEILEEIYKLRAESES